MGDENHCFNNDGKLPPVFDMGTVKVIHFSTQMSNRSSTWKMTTQIKLDINLKTNSSISIL